MSNFKAGYENEYRQMTAAAICTDSTGRSHFVDGVGPHNAELMFVGEAPGREEDKQGIPFVGAAGKLLDELLSENGMKRNEVYITNIVKCRPPDNRDPLPDEVKAGLPYLEKEVADIKPRLIIFLGRHSLNTFFPDRKISKVHGIPFRHRGQVYLPLYHPAAALYRNELKADLAADFKKIPKILKKLEDESTKITS